MIYVTHTTSGALNTAGDVVIAPQFDLPAGCTPVTHFYDDGYAIARLNGKQGVIDRTGAFVIQSQFDDIYLFNPVPAMPF